MPAAKKLVTTVHVMDEDGLMHVFGPDDTIPAWARKAIVNPKAWGGEAAEVDLSASPAVLEGDDN